MHTYPIVQASGQDELKPTWAEVSTLGKHPCVYSCLCVVLGILSADGSYGQSWRRETISWGFISLVGARPQCSTQDMVQMSECNAQTRGLEYQFQCSLTNLDYDLNRGFCDYYLSLGSFD